MLADVRFALRLFARNPLFTAAVVLVLGLGIGATTTVFSLLDAYLVKPLPFHEPDRLVVAWRTQRPDADRRSFSQPDFLDLKEQATSFSRLAIVGASELSLGASLDLRGREAPAENLLGSRVSAEFFPLLGVAPALGRAFTAGEDAPGRGQVVIVSDALWRRRFSADPAAVGKTIALDGRPHQIVGVMPASFRMPAHLKTADAPDLWLPAALTRENAMARDSHKTTLGHVIGRLAPDVSFEAADAEVRAVAARLEQAHPDTNAGMTFHLVGLHEHLASRIKPALSLLSTATSLLLAIASANVALLLLARAASREGEAAVRAALGASRSQLMRQFFVESALLALLGGLAGFALAAAGTRGMAAAYQGSGISPHEARPDARAFAFALLAASVVGLGCGVASALRASGARLHGLLKAGAARSTSGPGHRRLQATLLAAEVALSTVLLAASAAVAHGFHNTLRAPLGFQTEGALTFSVRLIGERYPDAGAVNAFHQAALERLRALPSASSVGVADYLPLSNIFIGGTFELEGKPLPARGEEPSSMVQHVDAGYFRSLGVPVVRGRAFADADGPGSGPVAVVSESFARRFLPGEDPLGKRLRQTNRPGEPWACPPPLSPAA